jgi:hypothetical protein
LSGRLAPLGGLFLFFPAAFVFELLLGLLRKLRVSPLGGLLVVLVVGEDGVSSSAVAPQRHKERR